MARLLQQRSCGTSTAAARQSCQEERGSTGEAEASQSLRRSCLLPTKDELGKTIIVMLIVCTKVTKSILFVLLPQLAAA